MDSVRIRHPEFAISREERVFGIGNERDPLAQEMGFSPTDTELLPALDDRLVDVVDTSDYPLDDFNRTLNPLGYSTSGDGGAWSAGDFFLAARSASSTDLDEPDLSVFSWIDMVTWADAGGRWVTSTLGTVAHLSTARPDWSDCTDLDTTFSGWKAFESWVTYVVPAHPTDLAGISIGPITFTGYDGSVSGTVAQDNGAFLVVSKLQPSVLSGGVIIAALPHGVAVTALIPEYLVPDAGDTLYVGVIPGWSADYGEHTCGQDRPWADGQGNSGEGSASITDTLVWKSWDTSGNDWGAGQDSDDTDAWWDGSLPWNVAPSVGGTFGITPGCLFLTVSSGSQETLFANMEGTSLYEPPDSPDTSYGEPWSHPFGVNMTTRFQIATAGDVSETGSRYLYFRWHDGKNQIKVTVWLGDGQHAEGLSLSSDQVHDEVSKAITEGSHMWVRVDTRNPDYVRCKLWVESGVFGSGEPPAFDLVIERSADVELPSSNDYFEIGISAGNQTGADQTVQVCGIWFHGPGEDHEWFVEKIGQGDGVISTFVTSQAYKKGSLWFFVDGIHIRSETLDSDKGEFRGIEGVTPSLNANLVTRYLVNRNL